MTQNSNEIPSNQDGEIKAIAIVPEAVHYSADGEPTIQSAIYKTENVSGEEAESVVEQYLGPDQGAQKKGRNMAFAAFTGAWNSSWETEADRKKRENAHLN